MATRVISFIRYSSGGQALGDSERRQLELAEEWCRENGHTLAPDDVRRDLGSSAFRDRTDGAFAELLASVRAGAFERGKTILIAEAWDRLWREPPLKSLNEMTSIILAGIKIVTLRDKLEHDEASCNAEPYRLFHSLALLISANAESQLKSERLKKSYAARRKLAVAGKGMVSTARKAWLDIDPETGKFVPNKEGAATVKRIFEMVAGGMGCFTVARQLEREYRETGKPVPLSGGKKSNGWNKSRIQAIIKSDAPLGVYHAHTMDKDGKTRISNARIERYYPIIVDQSLADRARAHMKARTFGHDGAGAKGAQYTNLFTNGLARCACGSPMVLTNRHMKRQLYGWLRCRDALAHSRCESKASFNYPHLEKVVLRDVDWFETIYKHLPRHDPTSELVERIAEKEAARVRIDETLKDMKETFGEKARSAIADLMNAEAERRDLIDQELEELRKSAQMAEHKAKIPDLIPAKDKMLALAVSVEPQKRYEARARIAAALRETISNIVCHPDRTVTVVFSSVTVAGSEHVIQPFTFRVIYDAKFNHQMLMEESDMPDDERQVVDITGVSPAMVLSTMQMHLGDGRIGFRDHGQSNQAA